MAKFTDRRGHAWFLSVTVGSIRRVKTQLKIDLYTLVDDQCRELFTLLTDMERLIDVLFVMTHPETGKDNDAQEFAEAFDGETLEEAGKAFLEALADFFPSPRREILQKLFRAALTVGDKTQALATTRADRMLNELDLDQAAERMFHKLTPSASNAGSGSSPASSESIRIHSP